MFVSLAVAAAVSALLVAARRRRAARYRPGSRRRGDDLPLAPVVYRLRLAHLRAERRNEDAALETETDGSAPPAETPAKPSHPHEHVPAATPARAHDGQSGGHEGQSGGCEGQVQVLAPRTRRVIAATSDPGPGRSPSVLDIAVDQTDRGAGSSGGSTVVAGNGAQLAFDLAGVHGLGLIGPGSYAAARALLLTALTTTPDGDGLGGNGGESSTRVFVPVEDLARLLGVPPLRSDLPETVTVVPDLASALVAVEPDHTVEQPASTGRRTLLIASPPREPDQQARLQQLLDNGAPRGITALLLGQWRAGVTGYVTAGGLISATDPGLGEPLRGTRAFALPETATRDLLGFLRTTQMPGSVLVSGQDVESAADPPSSMDTVVGATSHPPEVAEDSPRRLEIITGSSPEPPPPQPAEHFTGDQQAPQAAAEGSGTPAPLVLTVFGAVGLYWRPDPTRPGEVRDVSGELTSRPVELLVLLAAHPAGASRNAVIDALWPDRPPRNPGGVLRTVLSRIRRALGTATGGAGGELVLAEHGHYRLNPAVVEVDYWAFADAVTRRRTATTAEERIAAYEAIVAGYGGRLAEGLDAEWLAAAREASRRDTLDAVAALARARVDTDPDCTLDLLETARAFDPYNELLYRDIMRLQHKLGRHESIARTLTLLETRLSEVETEPSVEAVDLARRLRERDTGIPVGNPPDPPRHE